MFMLLHDTFIELLLLLLLSAPSSSKELTIRRESRPVSAHWPLVVNPLIRSHGIRYPRPDAAQPLASDGDGDRGSDRAQPLATEGGGDGGSGTAQPLASAGSSTRRAGRKEFPMSDFFRA